MNEDFATRAWAEHHATLSQGIDKAVRAIMDSFEVLRDKQFDAPWRPTVERRDCAEC